MPPLNAIALFVGLLPLWWLGYGLFAATLGPNPVETLQHTSGDWALRFLLLTLACTPLGRLGWRQPMRLRRQWGLLAFFYALLHLSVYLVLDHELDPTSLLRDLLERPYITLGMLGLLLLLPLAITSTHAWQRKLGRNWRRLHTLVYPAALLAVGHYYLLVKADTREPLLYAGVLLLLLLARLAFGVRRKTTPAR